MEEVSALKVENWAEMSKIYVLTAVAFCDAGIYVEFKNACLFRISGYQHWND